MSGLVKDNIFRSSGSIIEAAGGLSWQPVVVSPQGATFIVTVQNVGGANYYYINGVRQDTLSLKEGFTYRFDQADSSNSGHPFRFSTTSNGTHGGGSEYTTGVTTSGTPGNAGAYTQIAVAVGAPVLYYYCTNHNYMGGTANTVSASVSVSAGKGYFVNTTGGTITIELPSSAEAGDQIILVDYARTWGTNKLVIDSNGLKFQGETDAYTVDYDTSGQSLNLVYSGATVGWTPSSDIVNALEPVAPPTQRAIMTFQNGASGYTNTINLIASNGVVASDSTGTGTARAYLNGASYGGDKGIFAFGNSGAGKVSMSNLVNNNGGVSADVTGVGTARATLAAAGYGFDKAIFGYGQTASGVVSMSNLVSNQGVVASDVTGVGTARGDIAGVSYGSSGQAVFAYGENSSGNSNLSNLVSNVGVIGSDVSGVGTARRAPATSTYGGDKAIFCFGGRNGANTNARNLVNNLGVIASDASGAGTSRAELSGTNYGGDKGIVAYGSISNGNTTAVSNLISNSGVVASDTSGVGTVRVSQGALGYSSAA